MPPVPAARQLVYPLRGAIIRYPTLPLAAAALGIFVWFAAANGGFDGTTWYPGALFVLGLLAIALATVPRSGAPRLVVVAVLALAGYAAWSYLSISWADQKADAWDGANRSLLYALVFALFALWRPRARPATALVVAFVLAVTGVGLVDLLRAASADDPEGFFVVGRFAEPAGYMNANVALWFMAFWPCVTLGARREMPPALRGVLVTAAVLLCGFSVLGQSRGWLLLAPLAALVFIALVPRRVRTTLTLLLVLAATGVAAPKLLDVYQAAGGPQFDATVPDAVRALIWAAVVAGVGAWAVALADHRARPSARTERMAGRGLAASAALVFVLGMVVFVSVKGSPFTYVADGWREFKTENSPFGGESRFSGSLGSNRYDFWRVAWHRFEDKPITGIGADNFQQAYLAERRSLNDPRYPHSIQLRTISQTGLVGAALLIAAMGAALTAALRAIRRRSGLGSATAAAATASFAYWLVHGTVDWFWEFPALGATAFALLGLAAGLMPRGPAEQRAPRRDGATTARRVAVPALAIAAGLAVAVTFALPWFAQLEQNRAVAVWRADTPAAYERLDNAASLNPLSATPWLLGGSIALRADQPERAERFFRDALRRDPGDQYAHLELGMLALADGRRRQALPLLERAARLNPRDAIGAEVLRRAKRGEGVNIARVNSRIAARGAKAGR
jgi:O-antigen ligase